MKCKVDQLRDAWNSGNQIGALRIAARFFDSSIDTKIFKSAHRKFEQLSLSIVRPLCPLLAQSGHDAPANESPLLGAKRKSVELSENVR
jgi:hypothetical protein